MNSTLQEFDGRRKKCVAEHASALLAQILNGTLAGGCLADPAAYAGLAIQAASASCDQSVVTVG